MILSQRFSVIPVFYVSWVKLRRPVSADLELTDSYLYVENGQRLITTEICELLHVYNPT